MNILYQLNDDDCFFPPADRANKDGLLAFGGDLSPQRLVVAYANGIFPWYSEDEPLLWWSLDPRLIIRPGEMKVSKSLKHTLRKGKFEVRIDTNFREVMLHCAAMPRKDQDGTWIQDETVDAYCELHDMGIAHSFDSLANRCSTPSPTPPKWRFIICTCSSKNTTSNSLTVSKKQGI